MEYLHETSDISFNIGTRKEENIGPVLRNTAFDLQKKSFDVYGSRMLRMNPRSTLHFSG